MGFAFGFEVACVDAGFAVGFDLGNEGSCLDAELDSGLEVLAAFFNQFFSSSSFPMTFDVAQV